MSGRATTAAAGGEADTRRWTPWLPILLVGGIVTRWPIVVSRHTYMDGDEALMALALKHALEGRGIPLFPYGAEFGLSFLETASGVLFASIFGLSETVLNISVFAVWLVGALCLVAAVRGFAGTRAATWAAVLAVSVPAWFHFSNVSWGYYHTAFLMSNATLLGISRLPEGGGTRRLLMAGIGLGASLTYYSQPIFALALIPFLGWVVWRRRRVDDVLVLAAVFAVCTAGYVLVRDADAYWAPSTFASASVVDSLRDTPYRMWINATGVYFLNQDLALGGLTRALALLWVALVTAAGAHALWTAWRARSIDVGVVCLAAVAVVCAFSLVVNRYQWGYRYLVPTVGFELVIVARMLGMFADRWRVAARATAPAAAAVFALAVSSVALEVSRAEGFSGSAVRGGDERAAVRALATYLEERGVHHAYAWEGMLQWKLMFESDERILARWIYRTDRIPEYPARVDSAFAAGAPVAIFGELPDLEALEAAMEASGVSAPWTPVADRYFVVLDPPRPLVAQTFRLNE